jgi:hypothetical protein
MRNSKPKESLLLKMMYVMFGWDRSQKRRESVHFAKNRDQGTLMLFGSKQAERSSWVRVRLPSLLLFYFIIIIR